MRRKLLGMMIASPSIAITITWGYWAGENPSWRGWLTLNAIIVGVLWLALAGVAVAFSESNKKLG